MRECWGPFVQHHCKMLIQRAHWQKSVCLSFNTTQRWLLIQLKTHREFQWIIYYSVLCGHFAHIANPVKWNHSADFSCAQIFTTIFDFLCNNYYISTSIFNQVKQRCGECGAVFDLAIWCRLKFKSHEIESMADDSVGAICLFEFEILIMTSIQTRDTLTHMFPCGLVIHALHFQSISLIHSFSAETIHLFIWPLSINRMPCEPKCACSHFISRFRKCY